MHRGRPSVLVVDEDSDIRCSFATWLTDAGYSCVTADDASTAMWYANRLAPVAAVIEVGRRHEGLRLASSLGHELSLMGVVLTAGHDAAESLLPLPDSVCGRLVKPITAAELVTAVRRACVMRQEFDGPARAERRAAIDAIARRQSRLGGVIAGATTAEAAHAALRHTFGGRVPSLFAHARRVAQTAAMLANALYLPPDETAQVIGAALLHDIGKLTLPERVLHGDLPLGEVEIEALGNHHARTLDLLSRAPKLAAVAVIVEHVQARWDGTGIPWGLAGENIPIGARVVAVGDAIDAARRSAASGAASIDPRYAVLMRGSGTRLDPNLVRVCLHTFDVSRISPAGARSRSEGPRCS